MENKGLTPPLKHRPWFFWFTITAGLLFLGFGVFAGAMILKYYRLDQGGYTTSPGPNGVVVSVVDPGGPADGKLQPGDKILAINGDARFSRVTQFFWRSSFLRGGEMLFRIERNGVVHEARVSHDQYAPSQRARNSGFDRNSATLAHLALTEASQTTLNFRFDRTIAYFPRYLAFLVIALLIGLFKPEDKRARLVAYAFLAISHQAVAYTIIPLRGMFNPIEDQLAFFFLFIQGAIWFVPVVYHSAYRLQEAIPEGRLWTAIQWSLYTFGVVLFLNRVILSVFNQTAMAIDFRSGYYQTERLFNQIENWYWPLGLMAISAVLIRNKRVALPPDQRRRISLVLYGSLIATLPQTVVTLAARIAAALGYVSVANGRMFDVLRMITAVVVILSPISWGYAILNRQVYDIQVVIRRSVQYLLAKNALRLLLALPVIGILYVVATKSDRSLRELIAYLFYDNPYYLLLVAAAAAGLLYRGRLQDWIDRMFFREAYQQDKLLRELSEEVRKLDSMSEMSRLVSQKVVEALHPERLYLFYREEDKRDLSLGYSSAGSGKELSVPEEYELLLVMEHHGKALDFPFPSKIKLPQRETDWLESMGTSLIVPMNGAEQRLAGLLLLGPKKSEEPYSGSDRQLLDSLAAQIAIVYENVRLKERVARDRKIQQEILARVEERKINLLKECPRCGRCYDSSDQTCADDRSELRLTLPVERTVEGRYRLDKLIGKGGMGAVYSASDIRLNRGVAVKILSGGLFGNPEALRRFQREARASARLTHPNIVRVYDYGALSAEGAYLVMELLKGNTLGGILRKNIYLEPDDAADLFDQIFSAMEAAHEAGIIHRDLKPDNIFVVEEPESSNRATADVKSKPVVKVLDFGIAKITQIEPSSESVLYTVTSPGAVLGTFGFMPPEQLTGGEVDQRSDIFSLGVIVVKTLTGRNPFTGKTYQELITAITTRKFHLPGSSPEARRLDAALQKCLATDPERRFASVAEMRRELIPAIRQMLPLTVDPTPALDLDMAVTRKYDDTREVD